jgi:predicted enzyme related to lactoylglutathione lyase
MDTTTNALNWFEIPATDIERAKKFYEAVFGIEMQAMPVGDAKMFTFPFSPGNGRVSGAIMQHEMYVPSTDGVTVYLNANPNIQDVIDRIEPAGGKIVIPKTQISPEIGYMCFFIDSEGNRIALHAQN